MTQSLAIENLSVGEVHDVSLQVGAGQIICLSGPSGSGKTRILRAIADLDPHEGSVRLGGCPAQSMTGHEWRGSVMLVPAESRWWGESVREHCDAEDPEDLEALGLAQEVLDWAVARLSSGEKQRLALYRAISHGPKALLLDEPTANLDEDSKHRVERWLLERIRRSGLPVIWVAHDPEQIRRVADGHYRIRDGRVVREEIR